MAIIKRIINILATISYIFIIIYAVICVPLIFGYHPVVVLSESMEPTYKVGSVIYYKKVPEKELKKGDVITFNINSNSKYKMASHRIVSIENGLIETKGDANKASDVNKIQYNDIKGKVGKVSIPYIGYYVKVINDHLLIVVISTIIILLTDFIISNIESLDINNKNRMIEE